MFLKKTCFQVQQTDFHIYEICKTFPVKIELVFSMFHISL